MITNIRDVILSTISIFFPKALEVEKGGKVTCPISYSPATTKQFTPADIPEQINAMISISDHLLDLFTNAIAKAFPQLAGTTAIISPVNTNAAKFGDYQCNSAMSLAKTLKASGVNKSPRDIAQEVLKQCQVSPLVEKAEVAGAGFINVFLKK